VSAAGWGETGVRWLKFNFVGAVGIGVQLGALALLTRGLRLHYLWATALAVEVAVLHNFVWHQRFTWADRVSGSPRETLLQLTRWNLSAGAASIAGNLLLMFCLVDLAHLPPLPANLLTIAVCSSLNFLLTDRWVFAIRN
jgi:putative flippase GtrA